MDIGGKSASRRDLVDLYSHRIVAGIVEAPSRKDRSMPQCPPYYALAFLSLIAPRERPAISQLQLDRRCLGGGDLPSSFDFQAAKM